MESLPSENLLTIKNLLQTLLNQLNESNTHIAALETLSKELVPDQQALSAASDEASIPQSPKDDTTLLIQKLEDERLLLLMDIQKQDFVTTKLNEIVQQNFDMVETIKDYLLNSNQVHTDELKVNNLILENYTQNVIKPVDEKLQINVIDLQLSIKKIEHVLAGITSSLQENKSFNYSATLSELIRGLNALLDKEF